MRWPGYAGPDAGMAARGRRAGGTFPVLVLSRRQGTSILVGHDVRVTVEIVLGEVVCLSVTGPVGLHVQHLDELQVAAELARRGRAWDGSTMHVLSKQPRPGLLIADEVVVTVQAVGNDSVRIGLEAPAHVLIYREEVYEQMQEANRGALAGADGDLAGLAGRLPSQPARGSGSATL
jgi:carbon storage regulator